MVFNDESRSILLFPKQISILQQLEYQRCYFPAIEVIFFVKLLSAPYDAEDVVAGHRVTDAVDLKQYVIEKAESYFCKIEIVNEKHLCYFDAIGVRLSRNSHCPPKQTFKFDNLFIYRYLQNRLYSEYVQSLC